MDLETHFHKVCHLSTQEVRAAQGQWPGSFLLKWANVCFSSVYIRVLLLDGYFCSVNLKCCWKFTGQTNKVKLARVLANQAKRVLSRRWTILA